MTKERTEKITSVDKMSREKMQEAIKAAKKEADSLKGDQPTSICDVMKDNTSEVIQRLETQIPTYMQLYSDLYTKYLHMVDDMYSSCYLAEKEFFDKIGVDKDTVGAFETYWKFITDMTLNHIEQATSFAKTYVKFRLSMLDSYDQAVHLLTDNYAKAWNWFNSNNKK
jgi:hypothetical protein